MAAPPTQPIPAQHIPAQRIPELQGTTFDGVRVSLPQALDGKVGILVIGFSRASQQSARAWGERLAGRYPSGSSVVFYEMPVVAEVPSLLRGWVLGRIRQGVPEPARHHFLPVLDHAEQWKQAVGGGALDDTSVLVIDALGQIRWRERGPVSDATFAELERQVNLLLR